MNWAGLQTELAAQLTTIAGHPATWRDVTSTWESWPRLLLSVVSVRKVGQDETRTRYVDEDDALIPRQYGNRVVTVQVTVESRDQNLITSAASIADTARTRLGRPAVLAALRTVDLAVSQTSDVRVIDRMDDKGRMVSFATFEVVFLTHVSDEEDRDASLGVIATVEITQTLDPAQDEVLRAYDIDPVPWILDEAGGVIWDESGRAIDYG